MQRTLAALFVLAAASAAPLAAHAGQIGLRVGLEAPLVSHVTQDGASDTASFTQEFEPSVSVLLGYVVVPLLLAIEAEISEAVLLASRGDEAPKRTGTTLRVGAALTLLHDPLPLYVTAMVPFHLEPEPRFVGLRLGVGTGFRIPIPNARFFVEVRWVDNSDVDRDRKVAKLIEYADRGVMTAADDRHDDKQVDV